MIWFAVVAFLVLLVGLAPLRRAAFGRRGITFTLPAAVGAVIGLAYGLWVQAHGTTVVPGLPLICGGIGAIMMGAAGKKGLDNLFHNRGE